MGAVAGSVAADATERAGDLSTIAPQLCSDLAPLGMNLAVSIGHRERCLFVAFT
jgi:hypothetical protein